MTFWNKYSNFISSPALLIIDEDVEDDEEDGVDEEDEEDEEAGEAGEDVDSVPDGVHIDGIL